MEKVVLTKVSGDLGDQFFIIASSYSYAKKEDATLKILKTKESSPNHPVYWETLLKKIKPYLIDKYEDIFYTRSYIVPLGLKSVANNYDYKKIKIWNEISELIYEEIPKYEFIYLNGKMQSYKYFNNDKEDIKKLFKPEPFLVEFIKKKYDFLMKQKDRVVIIHSCQKYYEAKPCLYKLGIEYYKKAINKFIDNKPNSLFLLCIDDEKLCDDLKTYIEINKNESFILKEDELLTFTLLQEFKNFIMSNCGFIWWCIWLSDYKHVIVPREWFIKNDYNDYNDYNDLYDDKWIRMD